MCLTYRELCTQCQIKEPDPSADCSDVHRRVRVGSAVCARTARCPPFFLFNPNPNPQCNLKRTMPDGNYKSTHSLWSLHPKK